MKIATWNVNSLRVRLPQVLDWIGCEQPDMLCLQETKVTDEEFPLALLRAAGYYPHYTGQKSYNGVATLTRSAADAVTATWPDLDSTQKRTLALTVSGVRIVNVYVPNGEAVGSDKYTYKLTWLNSLRQILARELKTHARLVVVGDFNIAPEDRDVHDPKLWRDQVLCSEPEREALQALLAIGLVDVFRRFDQPPGGFSWWDYRQGAFRRNHGLRLDLILASPELAAQCRTCRIDPVPRALDRPSDHAPVIAEFDA